MNDLVDLTINGHGGLERWNNVKNVAGDMSITGLLWMRKGWPDALRDVHVTVDTMSQLTSYRPFTDQNRRSVCRPDHTVIETLDGQIVKERRNPRAAFQSHTMETMWDDLDLAYFSGYAMWNYLNAPFFFSLPGVTTEEIGRWSEDGEERRRLKVTFPKTIATHCAEQIFHIDHEGLIRRLDYGADVVGGIPTAHYASDYRDFDGIKVATKRRALRRKPDGTAVPDAIAVAIDIADVSLS